jgi:hypothetical protein
VHLGEMWFESLSEVAIVSTVVSLHADVALGVRGGTALTLS